MKYSEQMAYDHRGTEERSNSNRTKDLEWLRQEAGKSANRLLLHNNYCIIAYYTIDYCNETGCFVD